MTREGNAKVATLIVLAAALAVVGVKRNGWPSGVMRIPVWLTGSRPEAPTPNTTIYRLLGAARQGDVRAFLDCYTGQLQASLRQLQTEKGEAAMAAYVRDFNASIQGIALQEPERLSDSQARVRVEFIYRDRSEAQLYFLERTNSAWKISRVENTQRIQTPIAYGTPVE